ncbi:DUF4396 domain-containing protein [Halomicroarcula sp. F27]|uniref:DUF4396 domain-containing protein n=1 Tax=Haloarcula nitratireducens TaxID=2487749 RepID=A0AAW4PHM0_9EURY|nr:DUF4396 domain-containing protein [Halomicroarcula nitratireducens]
MSEQALIALVSSPLPQWALQWAHQIEQTLAPARDVIKPILSSWWTLGIWFTINLISLGVLWWDFEKYNQNIPSLMKFVWSLVIAYSGLFGLGVYWLTGRTQLDSDSLWKQGFRSTSHCYSGCGVGEVIGITAATIILSVSTLWLVALTFTLAFVGGFALTVGPLMQEGVGFREAMWDAIWSETPSITIMEIVAIGTDLLLAGEAGWTTPLFWTALLFSLTIGFFAAYPVNVALIAAGVKEGMGNPAEMDGSPNGANSRQAHSTD